MCLRYPRLFFGSSLTRAVCNIKAFKRKRYGDITNGAKSYKSGEKVTPNIFFVNGNYFKSIYNGYRIDILL